MAQELVVDENILLQTLGMLHCIVCGHMYVLSFEYNSMCALKCFRWIHITPKWWHYLSDYSSFKLYIKTKA